ncbi:endonuclease/exonuclease/phosphatase family protein [Leyella stercorea]|uniref:endonuclease/exonuclease/phosphatase family protein n=1 Tax=Leyella stercorea TaxID=363265 RepID=UPI001F40C4EB|nr:endonuclease/exonuclease/phosphatase family protein [Leyella stercorea]MCF2644717.1 endonuclease [Leyella stercorea]
MTLSMLLISLFTFVELNCENLFDCRHDSLKNDTEFLPDGAYHWTRTRYWQKLDRIGQTILSCGVKEQTWQLPDMVALCEVENDSVLHDLTRRSLLRNARYDYVMTNSPDERGIDVALMYSPYSFRLIGSHSVRVKPIKGMRPTRDILYASGVTASGDTLHVIVAHLPSRRGGEKYSRPFRMMAARQVAAVIDSIYNKVSAEAKIIVAGDFNDYSNSESMQLLCSKRMIGVSKGAKGHNGAKGTYRYQGLWGSLDHILVSIPLADIATECYVNDAEFLIERDEKYGGVKPRRNYLGPRYLNGFSDHLPLVARFQW